MFTGNKTHPGILAIVHINRWAWWKIYETYREFKLISVDNSGGDIVCNVSVVHISTYIDTYILVCSLFIYILWAVSYILYLYGMCSHLLWKLTCNLLGTSIGYVLIQSGNLLMLINFYVSGSEMGVYTHTHTYVYIISMYILGLCICIYITITHTYMYVIVCDCPLNTLWLRAEVILRPNPYACTTMCAHIHR